MISVAILCVVGLLSLPAAPAQTGGSRLSDSELEKLIDRAENLTNDLDDDFSDSLDKTRLDGTDEEDRLQHQAEALEDTMDEIHSAYKKRAGSDEIKDKVHRALTIAADIDRVVVKYRLTEEVEGDWKQLRSDLNAMARHFSLPEMPALSRP
jgi:hypothetical protein